MKKRGIITIFLCAALALPMQAAGYYQTKKVQYSNMGFYYNGVKKNLSSVPLVIDNKTYLPVRAVCEATGMDITWTGSEIYVSGNTYSDSYSVQAELQAKDYQIASLTRELEKLKGQLGIVTEDTAMDWGNTDSFTQTVGSDILGTELTATAKELESLYGSYFEDIDLDFYLSLASKQIRVNVTYDTSAENKAFSKLSSSKVRSFIKDVCETVRDRHDDIVITGNIRYNGAAKYSFNYSKSDHLSYSQGSYSYSSDDDLESDIVEMILDTKRVAIDDHSSSISIEKAEASISDSRERVTFYVYLNVSDSSTRTSAWNQNMGIDENLSLRSDMKAIARMISEETDYDIYGVIYDKATDSRIGEYDYQDNELETYTVS